MFSKGRQGNARSVDSAEESRSRLLDDSDDLYKDQNDSKSNSFSLASTLLGNRRGNNTSVLVQMTSLDGNKDGLTEDIGRKDSNADASSASSSSSSSSSSNVGNASSVFNSGPSSSNSVSTLPTDASTEPMLFKEVFVSYSRKDKETVKEIVDLFCSKKMLVWIDWNSIAPSVDWLEEIDKGIENCNAFVYVISPDSVASEICQREVAYAIACGKRIIPVVVRDVNHAQVQKQIASLNWIFMRPGTDKFDGAFSKIISSMEQNIDYIRAHTRLLKLAVDWKANNCQESFLARRVALKMIEAWLQESHTLEPKPTPLQLEFIKASQDSRRKYQKQKKRISFAVTAFCIAATIVSIIFTIDATKQKAEAEYQRELADQQRLIAEKERIAAVSLKNTAVSLTALSLRRQVVETASNNLIFFYQTFPFAGRACFHLECYLDIIIAARIADHSVSSQERAKLQLPPATVNETIDAWSVTQSVFANVRLSALRGKRYIFNAVHQNLDSEYLCEWSISSSGIALIHNCGGGRHGHVLAINAAEIFNPLLEGYADIRDPFDFYHFLDYNGDQKEPGVYNVLAYSDFMEPTLVDYIVPEPDYAKSAFGSALHLPANATCVAISGDGSTAIISSLEDSRKFLILNIFSITPLNNTKGGVKATFVKSITAEYAFPVTISECLISHSGRFFTTYMRTFVSVLGQPFATDSGMPVTVIDIEEEESGYINMDNDLRITSATYSRDEQALVIVNSATKRVDFFAPIDCAKNDNVSGFRYSIPQFLVNGVDVPPKDVSIAPNGRVIAVSTSMNYTGVMFYVRPEFKANGEIVDDIFTGWVINNNTEVNKNSIRSNEPYLSQWTGGFSAFAWAANSSLLAIGDDTGIIRYYSVDLSGLAYASHSRSDRSVHCRKYTEFRAEAGSRPGQAGLAFVPDTSASLILAQSIRPYWYSGQWSTLLFINNSCPEYKLKENPTRLDWIDSLTCGFSYASKGVISVFMTEPYRMSFDDLVSVAAHWMYLVAGDVDVLNRLYSAKNAAVSNQTLFSSYLSMYMHAPDRIGDAMVQLLND